MTAEGHEFGERCTVTGGFRECSVPEVVEAEVFASREAAGLVPTPSRGVGLPATLLRHFAVERAGGEVTSARAGEQQTVRPGPGSLTATVVEVSPPKPSRGVLPARVTGRVGRLGSHFTPTAGLAGSRVLLQARADAGDPWTTVDQDKVNRTGEFVVRWVPKFRLRLMRVALLPHEGFAGSAAAVPEAKISACKVAGRSGGDWSVTCRTTAKAGSAVRLLRNKKPDVVVDRARVRRGSIRLTGTGPVREYSIDITVSKRRHIRLAL